ncbi:MAG: alpha/beta hydrolase [Alphaproteobacteria bacterium]
MSDRTETIEVAGNNIECRVRDGRQPGVVFLGGFMSDMSGTKATMLDDYCRKRGQAYVRFDYSGHGVSGGDFKDGTIGQWAADAVAVLDQVTQGPQLLVGSSMGGWIALLLARARPDRVAGFVGIAAAPDFTEDMMWADFDETIRETLRTEGLYYQPSDYDDPYPITMRLIEEGRNNLVLRSSLLLNCPVRLIQGMQDPDVPWQTALRLAEHLTADDVEVTLVKNGNHSLSEPADLARLEIALDRLLNT